MSHGNRLAQAGMKGGNCREIVPLRHEFGGQNKVRAY